MTSLRKPRECRLCHNEYYDTRAFTTSNGLTCRWCRSDNGQKRKRGTVQVLLDAEKNYEMPNAVRGALRLATMTLEEIAREVSKTHPEHRLAGEVRIAEMLAALGIQSDHIGERR